MSFMKKNMLKSVKLLAFIAMAAPLATMAQTEKISYGRPAYFRPYDKTGLNIFETTKDDSSVYEGMKISFGAGFTQQFQNLKHENGDATGWQTTNRLYPLQNGFMTAQANLFTDVQLADGIRLNVTTYLSARHHNETWVKGGYIQFDKLPFKGQFWSDLMKYTTLKVGHFEVNYGDAHFRRPDGGHTLQSPFMEGNIMDAFATEIGGEVYYMRNGFFGMVGLTGGMIKGHVDSTYPTPQDPVTKRNPSIYLKAGWDKQVNKDVRVRFSGSLYTNSSQAGSGLTLFWGDRTGSNYQNVMEKAPAGAALPAYTAIPWSGRLNPGFSKKVTAVMLNGFAKVKGFEFFGTYETASGRTKTEVDDRNAKQYAVEGLYRFGANENLYLGLRYNEVTARLAGLADDITITRFCVAGGWFLTKNVLLKAEYVNQNYKGFPAADYRAGGKFNGYVVEAVVGF